MFFKIQNNLSRFRNCLWISCSSADDNSKSTMRKSCKTAYSFTQLVTFCIPLQVNFAYLDGSREEAVSL